MQKAIKYTIFRTTWGYFGLAGTGRGLLRTRLPGPEPEKVKSRLLKDLQAAEYDKTLFKTVQEQITAYFEGTCVNFGLGIPLVLDGFSRFAGSVLTACREIRFGQTISYGRLAKRIGRPLASMAVGGVMAKNPLPLIIPCHRVICANGTLGGFSTQGGVRLKKRLLRFESASKLKDTR